MTHQTIATLISARDARLCAVNTWMLRQTGRDIMVRMSAEQRVDVVVEAGWQAVWDDGRVCPDLVEAAYAQPRLRCLFPWTGMGELHFSRCTEYRWTWDIPFMRPAAGGTYVVEGPGRTQTVGPAITTAGAVAMVVARLPAGCGHAFVGTPEQLVAHEAAAPLLSTRWPVFTTELAASLRAEGEEPLAEQVGWLRVRQTCGCRDDFCQSFYTAPKPDGAYGDGHRKKRVLDAHRLARAVDQGWDATVSFAMSGA